jgi:hypothetical protein
MFGIGEELEVMAWSQPLAAAFVSTSCLER